jgi:glycosyltransferase involved in cell wall biosynthesis
MKIALYVPSWPPGNLANGIVTYASQLVPALRRLGHEVFVLAPSKATLEDDPYAINIKNYSYAPSFLDRALSRFAPETSLLKASAFPIVSALTDLVSRHAVDVFEMEESFGLSSFISKLKLVPVVVRLHGPWFLNGVFDDYNDINRQTPNRDKREGRAISAAQFVTSPSQDVLQAVKRHHNLKLDASRTIFNPLVAADRQHIWNVSECHKDRLLFVGRFDKRKGGDVMIRAFDDLSRGNRALKLSFVGPGTGLRNNDGEIGQIDEFVRDEVSEEARGQIEFLGRLDHAVVMSLRPQHFVTIVASRYENFPYSVLEAMAFGCPVVATDTGGIRELIKSEYNGLLVPPGDARALSAACRRLLDDPGLAARLGRQAWQDCITFYGPENIAEQTVEAYRRAIACFRCGPDA